MKSKWYANWLVIITVCLVISSLGIFVISLKDTIGIKQCAYGDDLGMNCICDMNGEVICDEDEEKISESISSSEFVSSGMIFSYEFQRYIDENNPVIQTVDFEDISHLGGGLKITLELKSLCNIYSIPAPQVGFYKLENERLTLTVGSNLTDESFDRGCVTQSTFYITNFNLDTSDTFNIIYQDEYELTYPANNCIYEGYVRNNGDVYNSVNGCLLCQCKDGVNICEKEDTCLE